MRRPGLRTRGSRRRDSHESVQLDGDEVVEVEVEEKSPDERGERAGGDGLGLKSGGGETGEVQERQSEGRGAVQRPWFERSVLTAVAEKVEAIVSYEVVVWVMGRWQRRVSEQNRSRPRESGYRMELGVLGETLGIRGEMVRGARDRRVAYVRWHSVAPIDC